MFILKLTYAGAASIPPPNKQKNHKQLSKASDQVFEAAFESVEEGKTYSCVHYELYLNILSRDSDLAIVCSCRSRQR